LLIKDCKALEEVVEWKNISETYKHSPYRNDVDKAFSLIDGD
jgi:hypothetical protein